MSTTTLADVCEYQRQRRADETRWCRERTGMTEQQLADKHEHAKRLAAMTDGMMYVDFAATEHFEDDPNSMGHLYHGFMSCEGEVDIVTLDDRQPESLNEQFAAELRRIAGVFAELADQVAAA